jgi:hypothetical protein
MGGGGARGEPRVNTLRTTYAERFLLFMVESFESYAVGVYTLFSKC